MAALSLLIAEIAEALDDARFLFLRIDGSLDGCARSYSHRPALRGRGRIEDRLERCPVELGGHTEEGKQRGWELSDLGDVGQLCGANPGTRGGKNARPRVLSREVA